MRATPISGQEVADMRAMRASGVSAHRIAADFDLDYSTAYLLSTVPVPRLEEEVDDRWPLRRCKAKPPALPPRRRGEDPGVRAFRLMAFFAPQTQLNRV